MAAKVIPTTKIAIVIPSLFQMNFSPKINGDKTTLANMVKHEVDDIISTLPKIIDNALVKQPMTYMIKPKVHLSLLRQAFEVWPSNLIKPNFIIIRPNAIKKEPRKEKRIARRIFCFRTILFLKLKCL